MSKQKHRHDDGARCGRGLALRGEGDGFGECIAPARYLLVVFHSCVGRTGGWEHLTWNLVDVGGHFATKDPLSCSAVEANQSNTSMGSEEGLEIVRNNGG